MALLVTLLLVLINISNGVTASMPLAEGVTAIEAWIFGAISFVAAALLEYALLLFLEMER